MILNKPDAIYAATKLIKYFENFGRIDDYFRARKIERVSNIPQSLPGFGLEDDMFTNYDMHPNDMNFSIVQMYPIYLYSTNVQSWGSISYQYNPLDTTILVVNLWLQYATHMMYVEC